MKLGAHHIIDHTKPLADELKAIGHANVTLIASLTGTEQHFPAYPAIIAPQGKIGMIDDPAPLDVSQLRRKAASLHCESMFTRSMFQTPDMIEQHKILTRIAELIDQGKLIATANDNLSPINADNILEGHRRLESGTTIGKLTIAGWK